MGRELKRVALDFKWPINKVWKGFVNPYFRACKKCKGTGVTTARIRLDNIVGLLMLSGSDAKRGENHPYFQTASWTYQEDGNPPSADMVDITTALAGRAPDGWLGHDACDRYSATKKIIAAAGLPKSWGSCAKCAGEGIDPDAKAAYDSWEKSEPPAGEGFQMWETVSEGSPISPVFKTADELAQYLSMHPHGIDVGTSKEQWLAFINGPKCAPTMIMIGGKIQSGVQAVSKGA